MIRFLSLGLFLLPVTAFAADWVAVTADLIKAEKPGYGNLCGVAVDHASGDVFINLSDKGLYRSTDQGTTWKKHGPVIKGRTEWPGCLQFDPTGQSKGAVLALVYGAPISLSADRGETWSQLDGKSAHVDWAVVNWADPDAKFILALKHEAQGLMIVSHDGGKSFTEVGKGYASAWIFDIKTAVVAEAKTKDHPKPSFMRTVDGGKTFSPVGEFTATALPKYHDGTLYWLTSDSLITTTDQGKSWKKLSDLKDGMYGPIFGKDAKHMFVLAKSGIIESTDGGATWGKPIAFPKDLKGWSALTWLEYDPKGDVLYVMKMTSDLFRMRR
jgi:photosystem II stability/assembly factor-like uncharacterized protein